MKKYTIDYGFGRAYLYTPYPNPEVRFMILADTCFGIRKSIMGVRILKEELFEEKVEWNEKLAFNGDAYIWREDGARKMIEPDWAADEEWDTAHAEEVKYVEDGV